MLNSNYFNSLQPLSHPDKVTSEGGVQYVNKPENYTNAIVAYTGIYTVILHVLYSNTRAAARSTLSNDDCYTIKHLSDDLAKLRKRKKVWKNLHKLTGKDCQ